MTSTNDNEPHAITGVVRPKASPEPLRELSALLGFDVAGVVRGYGLRHPSGVPGLHQPRVWWLVRPDGTRTASFTSDDLRRADRLNEVALTYWRRSPELGRLTALNGRRALRLMHEVIESTKQSEEGEETS